MRFFFFKADCFAVTRGSFSFLSFAHTASSASLPPAPRLKEVVLRCSRCKSPGSDNTSLPTVCHRFLQSLFTVVLSRASLSQGSGTHQPRAERPLDPLRTGPEHLHYVSSKPIAYITARWGGPYTRLISLGFEGVLPERKESISVKRLICIHLLICCFYGESSFSSSSISLSFFLSSHFKH